MDIDLRFKTVDMENTYLNNEIKKNNAIEEQLYEMRLDMIELKNKFLELCEIVNELPCHEICKRGEFKGNESNRTK